jgi:hypothetical protein
MSQSEGVGIATGYGLDDLGSIPGIAQFFCPPQRPDRFWDPPSFFSNGYREQFPREYSGRSVKLSTYLQLVPRSRIVELYLHSPICLHGMVLN